jgi:hypothetical protein
MSAKHTPGPWAFVDGFQSGYVVPLDHVGRKIGAASDPIEDRDSFAQQICVTRADRHGRSNHFADARLIAAAPDLLAACEGVLQAMRAGDYGAAFQAVHAAVVKATGSGSAP